MPSDDEISQWWTETLLGESHSAHPVLGSRVKVTATPETVELTGELDTPDTVEDLVREVHHYAGRRRIVNRIRVLGHESPQHMQTVLGIFANEERARLAAEEVHSWGWHPDAPLEVVATQAEAGKRLASLGEAAGLGTKETDQVVRLVGRGKALLMARLPEDDVFRVVSRLEGSDAEAIRTLPPEEELEE